MVRRARVEEFAVRIGEIFVAGFFEVVDAEDCFPGWFGDWGAAGHGWAAVVEFDDAFVSVLTVSDCSSSVDKNPNGMYSIKIDLLVCLVVRGYVRSSLYRFYCVLK